MNGIIALERLQVAIISSINNFRFQIYIFYVRLPNRKQAQYLYPVHMQLVFAYPHVFLPGTVHKQYRASSARVGSRRADAALLTSERRAPPPSRPLSATPARVRHRTDVLRTFQLSRVQYSFNGKF